MLTVPWCSSSASVIILSRKILKRVARAVILWCMNSAAALTCDGYGLESSLVEWQRALEGGLCGDCTMGLSIILGLSLKLTNHKRPKVTCLIRH